MGPSNLHTQLQFNRNVPALPANLAIRYSGPRPIIIEKLRPPSRASPPAPGERRGPRASGPFSAVSEEKLNLALHLAKRDIKRKQLEQLLGRGPPQRQPRGAPKAALRGQQPPPGLEKPVPLPGRQPPPPLETPGPRAKVYLSPRPLSSSPPTRDPGPQPCAPQGAQPQSILELRRLQRELSACLQRIEGMAAKDRPEEGLDPDEAERSRVRRQEQAARTARTLYSLQQQVKEIQEELDKLSPHRIKHTKKSRAMSRLAAAHRGAIRALQMFVHQFTDSGEHYRELGHLIRQLSICSARLDADPSVPDVVLDLLQQIEELDSLLERKQPLGKTRKCFPGVRSQSPLGFPVSFTRSFSTSPARERKPPVAKEKLSQEGRRSVVRKLLEDDRPSFAMSPLCQMLGDGLGGPEEALPFSDQYAASTKAKAVKKRPLTSGGPLRRQGPVAAAKSQQGLHKAERPRPRQAQGQDCHFQRTTVSFRLKRNQPPIKDHRTPWIPPNPTSPPASPKCVAWGKVSASPKDAERAPSPQQEAIREERACRDPTEHEALRELAWQRPKTSVGGARPQRREKRRSCLPVPLAPSLQTRLAWLDAESARRMKELDELKVREMAGIQRLSSSTSDLADKVEKAVLERLRPLLERAKALPSEEFPASAPQDSAPDLHTHTPTQALGFPDENSPNLWIMMQRMEEMEQYQEAVRQRFSQMVYADLDLGTVTGRSNQRGPAVDERPRPPSPIQLTKKAVSRKPEVNIVLEKPLDEKDFDESLDMEERGEKRAPLRPASSAAPQQPEGSILLSVPREMLRSLGDYGDSYQQHLRTISHESVGTFNPWIIVESLAEELVEEALEDVAAELQDVCEDYAEAVFTSEFLEPSK
ncbi:protein moonraker isoform X2 [Dromiciops gliroides]|uniref:protein moonraker isoform X2 n=1 Tax=Dromiciops gliroides TaxID=33562 RepID=UPI001CC3B386|nr:protein moonraker isoform X2 [Dromiciops gliroides]